MRSTVSYMLSHGSGEPIMSHPDYEQSVYHHGCLLVLLRGIGPSKPRSLQKIFERVHKVNNVKITDSSGNSRDIWIRYIHDHPVENNDWGDFQTHRQLLGLVTIGKFQSQLEMNELCRLHESLKVKYGNTLYDSRSILFGPSGHADGDLDLAHDTTQTLQSTEVHPLKAIEDEFPPPTILRSRALFYRENDQCQDLEDHMTEYINSLFYILESKRLKRTREKVEKVGLLLAPFEKKDFVGLDMESRTNRKRCIGRVTKNLADLTLQSGLVAESLNLYHAASETLRAIGDALWLGASEEGLCAASAILLYPQSREVEILHRNASLQEGSSPQKVIAEKRKAILEPSTVESHVTSNSSSSSSVSSILTSSSSSASLGVSQSLPQNILRPDEISLQYRRSIINYSKYSHAAIIETEAALKAARICIEQCKNLDVSMFLQNILFINVNMTELERVKRFEVLTDLYQQIGYHRKAAFCRRLAAWKYVLKGNPIPDWQKSYKLMLDSFPGYMLTLDPLEMVETPTGWPTLQIDLLQSLITAASRIGHSHSALATRHMTFLLQTQWENMSIADQGEMAVQLQNLSSQCEGSPVPLVLESGIVIPPANLTDIPFCMQMVVKDLPTHLRPHKIEVVKSDNGPFLFTPIHFNSVDRREKTLDKIAFKWVQHDLSEISIKLRNNLPFELVINDMRLLTNGIVFESIPQTVILQPAQATIVVLKGTPIETGQLEIQGYSTHTLGIKSNCRLKHMHKRKFPPNYLVDVLPALPRINARTSLSQGKTLTTSGNVICSANLTLYNGESSECVVTIINETLVPVEHLEIGMSSNVNAYMQNRIFQFSHDDIQSMLPIPPNGSIDFKVNIFGEADFVRRLMSVSSQQMDGPQSLSYSMMSSGHISLPSRMSSPTNQLTRRGELSSSFRSNNSVGGGGPSSFVTLNASSPETGNQQIEALMKIRYSGGEGMREGYCRQCAIAFNIEMLPSAQITNWDVLPAETPSQFYLVLDISNLTAQEMALNYTNNKSILIEAKESCRVPIPLERCSLEETLNNNAIKDDNELACPATYQSPPTLSELTGKACAAHITERVSINWMLTGTGKKGIASLKGISLTSVMANLISVAPLHWVVSFDNTPAQPQSEVVCTAGQRVALNITVCNQSSSPIKFVALNVQFYQDYLNGHHNYNLDTRVVFTGPNIVFTPTLQTDEKIEHEMSVIFLNPGRYKANIQCKSLILPELEMDGSIEQSKITREAFDHTENLYNSGICYSESQERIWKFIPPIEVTVIE